MMEQVFNILIIISSLFGFGFLVFVGLSPQRRSIAVLYLSLFVLFFTLHNVQVLFADYGFLLLPVFDRKLLLPFYALVIPFFYTFVTYYLMVENQLKSFVKISVALFLIEILFRLVIFIGFYNRDFASFIACYVQLEEIINLGFTLFLFLKIIYIFLRQSKLIETVRSYDNMRWLKSFLWFGFAILVFWIMAVIFNLNKTMNPNLSVYYPLRLSTSLIIIWICYYGFFKFSLLTERVQLRQILYAQKPVKIVKADFNDMVFQRVVQHLQTTQNYLQADYSVFKLQTEIYISRRKIADSLNFHTNKSFSDYINKMRIDKAMEILKNPLYVNYTIVSIGLECGFKSKSTFYREFLKQTGTTPTDFRSNNL